MSPVEFCNATKACEDGVKFAEKYETMAEVWNECPRADWLLWILKAIKAPTDERTYRLFAIWCARNTPLLDGRKTGDLLTDPRSLAALEVAERFANGAATKQELEDAWSDAELAAWSAAEAAASSAAWATASSTASSAARLAARAAAGAAASSAAWSAASSAARLAAWSAAWAAAGAAARKAQADEMRRLIKNPFMQ